LSTAKDTALLRDAVAAAKIGDKPLARALLREILESNPNNEQAWLWRAAVAEDRAEAMSFLEKVLAINPENRQALSTLAAYRIAPPPSSNRNAAPPLGGVRPAGSPPISQVSQSSYPPRPPVAPPASAQPAAAQSAFGQRTAAPPPPAMGGPRPAAPPAAQQRAIPITDRVGAPPSNPPSSVPRPATNVPRTIMNLPPRPINIPPRPTGPAPVTAGATVPAPGPRPIAVPPPAREAQWMCPLCEARGEMKGNQCPNCRAVLTMNDLDAIAGNSGVDEKALLEGIERNKVLAATGSNFQAHLSLALAYLNLKSSAEATAQIRAASVLQPDHVLLQRTLATLQSRRLVLVVDDSQTIRKVIATALERQRYRVAMAGDGMQALAKLDEEMPDLILLDITMPRMDGYQVCKVIKQNKFTKEIPVVMLSGNDGFFDKVKGRMAGATDYLTKPFEPAVLLKTIQKYCSKR
jgi:twitching motility two-component system response regulator PilG